MLIQPIPTARRLANLSREEAPAASAHDYRADDGKTLCWRVLFWASDTDADNDPGAKAICEVLFAADDPDGTATINRA